MSESRQPQRRSAPSGADPAARGLILVVVAVALGAILLAAGGKVGFDKDDKAVDIGDNGGSDVTETTEAPTETTEAPPVTVAPAEVAVVAANGAGISGLAGKTTEFLATQGYTNSTATDATASAASTAVYFAEGFQPNAAAIATLLGLPAEQVQALPAEPVATDQPAGSAVVVVVGPDAEAVVSAGATTTSSTAAPG
ncbi:MAG: LytR C-terminal domain-containing protein [Microthrixaceae bacterium]|nr:LytR C-terminal domain-containing protein [Microthrixaceae bacterium]MCB9387308.1 LytR C-terminal domain-containing protein [Microthrixaceae bacterium]MCO5322616.1 LytR C-terminal domain-containing protein [Microthrixaceae bacterium]